MERYLPLAKELRYEVFTFKYDEDDITRYEAKNYFCKGYGETEEEAIEIMLAHTAFSLWFMVENSEHRFAE